MGFDKSMNQILFNPRRFLKILHSYNLPKKKLNVDSMVKLGAHLTDIRMLFNYQSTLIQKRRGREEEPQR